jgi:hypothetical protein
MPKILSSVFTAPISAMISQIKFLIGNRLLVSLAELLITARASQLDYHI